MRRAIPFLDEGPPRPAIDGRASALDGLPLGDEQDFEYTWRYFQEIRDFWLRATSEGRFVIFTADQ